MICEETARVVRKIFELYLTSKSPVKIVQYLFENKIPTPAYYNYLTYGYNPKEWINATDEKKYTWYRNIITKAPQYLQEKGTLFLEIGYNQKEAVEQIAIQTKQYTKIIHRTDLEGNDRVIECRR